MNYTLNKQFPLTAGCLLAEIDAAEDRLRKLKQMKEVLWASTITDGTCKLEVIIPESDPSHRPGKSVGTDFTTCLKAAQQQSGRNGTAFAFINFGNLSLSVNPNDLDPNHKLQLGHQCEDPCKRLRFLWTNKERGCAWLVL